MILTTFGWFTFSTLLSRTYRRKTAHGKPIFFPQYVDRDAGKRSGNLYQSADKREPGGFVVI